MSIRARCPSCQTEYTLVDSLRGKYVRCERCHESFQAKSRQTGVALRIDRSDQFTALAINAPGVRRLASNDSEYRRSTGKEGAADHATGQTGNEQRKRRGQGRVPHRICDSRDLWDSGLHQSLEFVIV